MHARTHAHARARISRGSSLTRNHARTRRCIAVHVDVSWTHHCTTGQEVRAAFAELSAKAFAGAGAEDELPERYVMQQALLDGMMAMVNAEYGSLLKYYTLRLAREALSPTAELDGVVLTQLTFEGLTLQLHTVEMGMGLEERLVRQRSELSVLFDTPCACAEDVEERLIGMLVPPPEEEQQAEERETAEERPAAAAKAEAA